MNVAHDVHEEPLYGLGYYRISGSKEQKDSGLSIPAQESHVRAAMEREDTIFYDADQDILTGKRADRRGYQRILATARRLRSEGKRVAVFVLDLDRFGREVEERTRAWKELLKLGIRMYAVRKSGWIKDSFLYNLDSILAQREVDLISTRVKETNEFVRRNGFPSVGRVAWGYRIRPSTPEERAQGAGHKTIEPHPTEAPIVRRAFEMRASGMSLHRIHDWAITLEPKERGERTMCWQTFDRLFKAAVYVGRPEYPKDHPNRTSPVLARPKGKWEPLISDDLWSHCQAQAALGRRMPKQASGIHLLTGLLRCSLCGARMGTSTSRRWTTMRSGNRRWREEVWYRCQQRMNGHNGRGEVACSFIVTQYKIDDIVLDVVQRMMAPYENQAIAERMEAAWERLRRSITTLDDTPQRIAQTEARLSKWKKTAGAAFAAKVAGEITQRECDDIRAQAAGEIEDAERELARLRATLKPQHQLPRLHEVRAYVEGLGGILSDGTTARKRTILSDFLVSAEAIRVARGEYRVRFTWTDLGKQLLRVAAAITTDDTLLHVNQFGQSK